MEEEIRGEYWIEDGSVQFADGDIGDYNHEGIALEHVFRQFSDDISNLADNLNIPNTISENDLDIEEIQRVLGRIEKKLKNNIPAICQQIGCTVQALSVLHGSGHAGEYCMMNEGWIAVRGMNVELHGYDEIKRKHLITGLEEILYDENVTEHDELEFSLSDLKTRKENYFTWHDLKNPFSFRPQQNLVSAGDRRFPNPTDSENLMTKNKPVPNAWNKAAVDAKIIPPGHELWRGTSESVSFKNWLKINA